MCVCVCVFLLVTWDAEFRCFLQGPKVLVPPDVSSGRRCVCVCVCILLVTWDAEFRCFLQGPKVLVPPDRSMYHQDGDRLGVCVCVCVCIFTCNLGCRI